MFGQRLRAMACSVRVNAPDINDWDAMIVAAVAKTTIGISVQPGVSA
jgi:hypothetical protein